MVEIVQYEGFKLIKKYDRFYIRFTGGMYEDYPCDLLITEKEANEIIENNAKIKKILTEYRKKTPWTKDYFIHSALTDFMLYGNDMSEDRVKKTMEKFDKHNDIKTEFFETLAFGMFPVRSAIKENGYTAQILYDSTHLTLLGVYNYLIYLREDPANALKDLEKGLPIK